MKKFIYILLSLYLSANIAFAADSAVPAMTEDTTPSTDDLVYTVNEPGGVAGDRKVTLENLFKSSWWFRDLSDPNADRIVFWDESAGAGGAIGFLTVGTGLTISGTTITATGSGDMLKSTYDSDDDGVFALAQGGLGVAFADPNANRIIGWDDTDGAHVYMVIGSGLTYTAATNTLTATGTGDVTDVGPGYATGAAFTDGVVSTGTTMFVWEGTTADTNEFSIEAPSANPGADIVFTFPAATGTGVIGPAGFAADNILVKTDGTGNLMQATGITVDDSNNMSGIGTIGSGAITSSGAVKGTSIILEGGANDTTLIAGTPAAAITYTLPSNTGVEGQYLKLGASNVWEWSSLGVPGDIEAVGDCASGSCFQGTVSGVPSASSNTLYFEGATANDHEIALIGADAGADATITIPATTGTILVGAAAGYSDNTLIRADNAAAATPHLTQSTGITIDDSNNMAGVGTIGSGAITTSGNIIIGADPADAGTGIRMSNNTGIYFEDTEGTGEVAALVVDASEAILIGSSGADSLTITPNTAVSGTLTVTGALAANGGITMGTGDGFTVNSVNLLSGDELDGTKIKDAVYGDVTVSVDGAWAVGDDSHAHGSTTITLASTNLTDTTSIAMLADSETVTGSWTFGDGDTDTLALRSILRGANSRAIWIDDDTTVAPTYATATNELYVEGDIESAGTIYASTFVSTATGDSYISLTNNAGGLAPSGYRIYFETDTSDVFSYSINGTEKRVANLSDEQTFTALKTFSLGISVNGGATNAGQINIYEDSDEGSNYITLTAPALAGNYTLTLPTTDGESGQYLTTNGSGVTSWGTPTASSATDGGTAGVIQFNTSGSLDADASFKFTEATYTLTIGESNGSSLDGNIALFNESGGTDYTVTITPGTQSADATITLPGSTATLATLGLAETFAGNKTFSGTITASANTATLTHSGTTSLTIASTSGTIIVEGVTFTGDTVTGVSSLTVGALAGVNSIDATGAVDMDYGSADVTDHTFVSDGGTVIIDGSVTAATSFIIGSADLNETDMEKLDGITNGTQAANKAVVADANVNIGAVKASSFYIGASGSETQVTATAAELNYVDIAALGTGAASKAVVLDGSGNYTAPAGTWDLDGATAVSLPNTTLDDGTGASPSLTFQDGTDETVVFSKVDAGYLTVTTVAGDGVQITTGNLRVGNGSNGQTLDGEDVYVEGLVEVDGMIYADGGVTGALTGTASGNLALTGGTLTGNVSLDDGSGNSPTLTFQDVTNETAVFEKVDSGYLTITTAAADGVNVLVGNLKVGDGSPGQTIDGEDLYVNGLAEIDGVLYADGGISTTSVTTSGNIELGHASDNTLSASSGVLSIEGVALVKATSTQTLDFGGATLEIPNSDDPDVSVTGQISNDTDGWLRTTYDSGTTQKAIAIAEHDIHVTVVSPNGLADAVRDKFPVWSNDSGMTFVVTAIEAWSDVDNSVFSVLEYASQDFSSAAATIEASVDTGTTGTSVANVTVTSIDNPNIENGNMIVLDFDDTDDPAWVKITIRGYFNADVN